MTSRFELLFPASGGGFLIRTTIFKIYSLCPIAQSEYTRYFWSFINKKTQYLYCAFTKISVTKIVF
jgi:hypothetical protein